MRSRLSRIILIIASMLSGLLLFACSDKVTVTVELNGGASSYGHITVERGDVIAIPEAPTKDGCFFDGWWTDAVGGERFDFSKPVNGNITLYAHWTESGVAFVEFDVNSPNEAAEISRVPNGLRVKIGEKFTPPTTPICDGYTFKGWYEADGDDAVTAETVINGDITLYARWAKLYTVSFASDMGIVPDPVEAEENTVAVLPNITMDGYTLGEWCIDEARSVVYDETQPIADDITLYAKFYKHTSLDKFYFGSIESDGYARITGIKPEAIDEIGDTLVIPDITATGDKIGRFSILNTNGDNAVDLSGIKKVVLSNTLNKSFSSAFDLMENLESIVGGRGGRNYISYANCAYSNEDDAYYKLCYVPKAIADATISVKNDGTKIYVENDSSSSALRFDGLKIANVKAFEINGAPNSRLDVSIAQNINIVIIVPDEYLDEYATLYAKEFIYGVNGESGVLVFIPRSERDDDEYIADRTAQAIKARDEEIRRQEQEWLEGH